MGIKYFKNPIVDLKKIINDSLLSKESKELWYNFLDIILDDDALLLLKQIEGKKEMLEVFTENLNNKFVSIKERDKEKWVEIIKKEKNIIDSV
jgi:hypothetical protein